VQAFCCNVARSYLEQLHKGDLAYLDGFITPKVCDCLNHVHEVQTHRKMCAFSHFLQMPHELESAPSEVAWEGNMAEFKAAVEAFSGASITAERLSAAVAALNETRQLLRSLYELRKQPRPPISGEEVLHVVLAGMMAPTPEYNANVRELVAALENRQAEGDGVRLMVVGSSIDFTEMGIFHEIETTGGMIVTDEMCTGTRWIYRDVKTDQDPFKALAKHYHYAGMCAAKYPAQKVRMDNVARLARAYSVEGVVIVVEKFCDPFAFSAPGTEKVLRDELGLPVLVLESAEVQGLGQVKTRTQGFVETIRGV
jgi:benzoyl-CoA reductase subunit C